MTPFKLFYSTPCPKNIDSGGGINDDSGRVVDNAVLGLQLRLKCLHEGWHDGECDGSGGC